MKARFARSRSFPSPRRRSPTWRRVTTWLLVGALAFTGPGSVLAQSGGVDLDEALAHLQSAREALEAADAVRPDAYWAVDDLAFDLAFEDGPTIAAWVRDEIAYQPYRGVLRGMDGTLRAGAANAWDQALLLSRLLMDAGYSARIAHAEIDDDAARELVLRASEAELPAPDVGAALDAYLSVSGGSEEELERLTEDARRAERELEATADATADWLMDTLEAAGVELASSSLEAAVLDARDYAWVEYRLGPDEPWSAAHPAAPEGAAWTATLDPDGVVEDEIPADRQHRFRVQAVIERRSGDDLETAPVMEAWERPAANLSAIGLSYVAMPDGFLQTPLLPPDEAFERTTFVTPVFNGGLAPGGQLFDLLGNVVPPDAAASPAAGVFGQVAGALGDATSALSGEDDAIALTAHWLEFTFIAPGGVEVTERRMIFDRLGAERRAAGDGSGDLVPMTDREVYEALQTEYSFLLAPGRYAEGFVAEWNSDAAKASLEYLDALYRASSEDPTVVAEAGEGVPEALRTAPLLRAAAEFDDEYVRRDGVVSFRAAPALFVRSQAYGVETVRTDIVRNDRRAFAASGDGLVARPDAVLRAGVWESLVERTGLDVAAEPNDTGTFFASVEAEGIGVATLRDPDADLQGLALPDASLRAIADDLARGYVVVAATAMPSGTDEAAWWRVDPASGVTLGRSGDGRGQSALEYIVVLNSIFIGLVGFGLCRSGGGSMGCCIADTVTGVVGGLIVGALLAGASALAVASGGVLFDVYGLAAGGAGLSWCLLESRSPAPERSEPVLVRGPADSEACTLPAGASWAEQLAQGPWRVVPTTLALAGPRG